MDRDAFLRRVAPRPLAGPDLPDLSRLPQSPMELRPGEDPVERFCREAELTQATVRRAGDGGVGEAVAAALARHGARRIAVAPDLGSHLEDVTDAITTAGLDAVGYATAAAERDVAGALDATVTGCAAAVAATGSVLATATAGRAAALIAPLHVCVVERQRILPGLAELLRRAPDLGVGSMLALQSGPSRTADIEKTLIIGAHGAAAVEIVLV